MASPIQSVWDIKINRQSSYSCVPYYKLTKIYIGNYNSCICSHLWAGSSADLACLSHFWGDWLAISWSKKDFSWNNLSHLYMVCHTPEICLGCFNGRGKVWRQIRNMQCLLKPKWRTDTSSFPTFYWSKQVTEQDLRGLGGRLYLAAKSQIKGSH